MTGGLSSTLAALARANAAQRPMTRVSFEVNRAIGTGDRDESDELARGGVEVKERRVVCGGLIR